MQIEISSNAVEYLRKKTRFFTGKNRYPRIVLAAQSCRGSEFRLYYDFPRDDESRIEAGEFSFLVDPELLTKYGGFRLDTQSFFFTTKVLIEPYNDFKECKCKK